MFFVYYADVKHVACNSHSRPILKIMNARTAANDLTCAVCAIKDLRATLLFGTIGAFTRARSRTSVKFAARLFPKRRTLRTMQRCTLVRSPTSARYAQRRLQIASRLNATAAYTKSTAKQFRARQIAIV